MKQGQKGIDSARQLLKDYGWTIAFAVTLALTIRFFLIEAYRIPTPNMRPTLEPGDTIFVSKWPFGLRFPGMTEPLSFASGRTPRYGEVVVYAQPGEPQRESIRRVVALPGDQVEIRDGNFYLNGKQLRQSASQDRLCGPEELPSNPPTSYEVCWEPPLLENFGPERIPDSSVMLMGDFRVQWTDISRKQKNWHIVPVTALRAKAWVTWLSIEPPSERERSSWFSRIRFERMFRPIR